MQQFTVPQFLDVEDKIFGPISVRQFVIILADFLLIALFYRLFEFNSFLIISILCLGIGLVFAFVKVNGLPFHFFVLNVLETLKKPSMRLWNNLGAIKLVEEDLASIKLDNTNLGHKQFSTSHLNELALIVDTKGYYQGENDDSIEIRSIDKPNNF